MAYHSSVLSQLLKFVPRLEFERLANQHDGKRRSNALSRWSQFVALALGHLGNRHSLRDIEASLNTQPTQRYHLNIGPVSRSALARANERLDANFFQQLFYQLYARCQQVQRVPGKRFRFKGKLFSLDGSLIDLSMKVFPWATVAPKKAAFNQLRQSLLQQDIKRLAMLRRRVDPPVVALEGGRTFNRPHEDRPLARLR